jgi:hypothetical protein
MRIVPSFDELKDFTASLVLSAKSSSIYQFTFERGEETFTHRIVIAITNRSCRRSHTSLATSLSEGDRGVLSSLIRMMNNSSRPSLRDGHIKSLEHEFRTKMCLHRPANHAAAENIDHDRQLKKSRPGRNIGNISNPESIRLLCTKAPLNQIRCGSRRQTAYRCLHSSSTCHSNQASVRHQSGDPLLADRSAGLPDIGQHSRRSISTSREVMNLLDLLKQDQVLFLAGRWSTLEPRVIDASRDLQDIALQVDRTYSLVRLYEFVDPSGIVPVSRANQAAAFFRISRSCFSCRFSRRNRLSSSRSSVVRPSWRWLSSRSACATQFRIAWADGSDSCARSSGRRPTRTSSTIRRRNSAGYGGRDLGIL